MEEKMITKNATAVCPGSGVPDEEALSLISRYARNTPDAKDIYTFSVILCDNEIDRDNERFSVESLTVLKDMFEGVTGIFDHSMRSSDQTARVYKTELLRDETKTTAAGEVYTYIKAWCYMLRTEKNNQLISEIDGGIKKEVSISCSVENKICSVCGKDIRSHECNHIAGRKSGKTKCHVILENPTDAYEWSFVAVPAQRNAGVSKSVAKRDYCTEKDFVRKLSHMLGTAFDEQNEADTLSAFGIMLGKMKEDAMVGKAKRIENSHSKMPPKDFYKYVIGHFDISILNPDQKQWFDKAVKAKLKGISKKVKKVNTPKKQPIKKEKPVLTDRERQQKRFERILKIVEKANAEKNNPTM